jgi:hypothetical protein
MHNPGLRKSGSMREFLKFLHGEHPTTTDLILTYLGACLSLVPFEFLISTLDLSITKQMILSFIVLDFSGGIIANITESTSSFYASRPRLRIVFLLAHLVQPALLVWIFPENALVVFYITVYTLLSSIVVSWVGDFARQRTLALFLVLVGLSSMPLVLDKGSSVLGVCLSMYIIKLILSFSVDWSGTKTRYKRLHVKLCQSPERK